MIASLHPFTVFLIGAVLAALTTGRVRAVVLLATPAIGLANLALAETGTTATLRIFDYTLTYLRVDRLSLLFGYLFHIAAFIGMVFALHVKDREPDDALGLTERGGVVLS